MSSSSGGTALALLLSLLATAALVLWRTDVSRFKSKPKGTTPRLEAPPARPDSTAAPLQGRSPPPGTSSSPVPPAPADPAMVGARPGAAASVGGALITRGGHRVLQVAGSPTRMGRQHAAYLAPEIRFTIEGYIDPYLDGWQGGELRAAVAEMKTALPKPLREEIEACARAAGVDPVALYLAQCIGDVEEAAANHCSAYVAFGPATVDGRLEFGRNLDYGLDRDVVRRCALITEYRPAQGHAFTAVGVAGMLTGWTLINEHGLVVGNHLGGGSATDTRAIPTLLLARWIAQNAATVEEGVALLRSLPRMRGQIIWLAQDASAAGTRPSHPARAVALEYDNKRLVVREAIDGLLVVTNTNLLLDGAIGEGAVPCPRYQRLRAALRHEHGSLDGRAVMTLLPGVFNASTMHVVHGQPATGAVHVWHCIQSCDRTAPVRHPLPTG